MDTARAHVARSMALFFSMPIDPIRSEPSQTDRTQSRPIDRARKQGARLRRRPPSGRARANRLQWVFGAPQVVGRTFTFGVAAGNAAAHLCGARSLLLWMQICKPAAAIMSNDAAAAAAVDARVKLEHCCEIRSARACVLVCT